MAENNFTDKVTFQFDKNDTAKEYKVSQIHFDIAIVGESFPNAKGMLRNL